MYIASVYARWVDVRTVGGEGNERIEQRLVIPLPRLLFRDYDYYYCSKTLCAWAGRRGRVTVRRDMLLLKEPYPDLHGICPSNTRRPVSDLGSSRSSTCHTARETEEDGEGQRQQRWAEGRGQRAEDKGQRAEGRGRGSRTAPVPDYPHPRNWLQGDWGKVQVGLSTAHDPPLLGLPRAPPTLSSVEYR